MAISIRYRGKISNINLVNSLISEVDEIGKTLNWKTKITATYSSRKKYKPNFDLFGILVTPPKSDSIYFTFLPDGTLLTPMTVLIDQVEEVLEDEFQATTKTQFAGPDVHLTVVNLLKYVSKKYLEDFEVKDDTNYWETGNSDDIAASFENVNVNLEVIEAAVKNIRLPREANIQSFAEALDMILSDK